MPVELFIGLIVAVGCAALGLGVLLCKRTANVTILKGKLDRMQADLGAQQDKNRALQREVESLTRELDEQRHSVLDDIPMPICVFSRDGGFQNGNKALDRWSAGETAEARTVVPNDKFIIRLRLALSKHLAEMDIRDPRWDHIVDHISLVKQDGVKSDTSVFYLRPDTDEEVLWLVLMDGAATEDIDLPAFVERAPIGFAMLDRSRRIIDCNPAFAEMFDVASPKLATSAFETFVSGGDGGVIKALIDDAVAGNTESDLVEIRIPAEEDRFVTAVARPIVDDGSKIALYLIDISERKSLETQFAQSQKMQAIGQLAGGLAHDFNNLLTAMTGFCDLLLLRHRPGDQSFADIMQIKQNANRAANLVRQLLAFSRQQTLIPRVLDITDTLADLFHLLKRLIGENIELNMVHGRDPHPVRVDQSQLEQVIINLVVNARDAMTEGGKITMHTANISTAKPMRQGDQIMPPGDYLLIEVIDTGSGIAQENLERIFDPFFTTKSLGSGTGLGLATVYGIVHQTDGFIFVDSTVDVGTTFSIYLPAFKGDRSVLERDDEVRDQSQAADLTGYGRILLVEDEDPVRLFAARALRGKGYDVLEARSGEAALELLEHETHPIDLLITDVVMPGIDGPTLVGEVRQQVPGIGVICISGYSEDALRQRISEDADIQFLSKPFSLKQLAGKVKDVMARMEADLAPPSNG